MKSASGYLLIILFMALLVVAAGCTSSPSPGTAATPAPAGTLAPVPQQAAAPSAVGTAQTSGSLDTTIGVKSNDFSCLNVQDLLGVVYLYPGQKVTLTASPPAGAGVNVNVLLLDENDQIGLRQIAPQWDVVKKAWVYAGIVPVIQFNDLTGAAGKTVTLKSQSKYYVCVDDRKESTTSDTIYQVPITLQVTS